MISCKKVTELASKALDEKLSLGQRLQMKLHLLICKGCQHYCQQVAWLRSATRSLVERDENCSEKLSEEARSRIESKMRASHCCDEKEKS